MATTHLEDLREQADANEQAVPCPVCGGSRFQMLLTPEDVQEERRWLERFYQPRVTGSTQDLEDRVEFTQSDPTSIVRCDGCGTLLRDPRPTPEALRRLYAQDTYGEDALRALAANQEEFFRQKALAVGEMLPAGARILEIGPFVGAFLKAARTAGWRATGVDVGRETVAFMRAAGLDVVEGDACDIDLPASAWDGFFVWNTFDQLSDPGTLLARARSLLKCGGLLVVRVPNGDFESACLRLRGERPRDRHILRAQAYNNFLTFPYLTGYTPHSLTRLLESHAFTVERVVGDTILRLADAQTRPFAVREEQRYKRGILRAVRLAWAMTGRQLSPWIDVYARAG